MEKEGAKPVPDPTVLTTAAIERAVKAERDYLNAQLDVLRERLDSIDQATLVLSETVNRTPTEITKEIQHLRELIDEKFNTCYKESAAHLDAIEQRFSERDIRFELASKDNKIAVDAAFAAQKEAATEKDKSNTLAISKSETATTEAITKLSELFTTTTDALKERVGRIENVSLGGREATSAQRSMITFGIGVVVFVITVIGFVLALMAQQP